VGFAHQKSKNGLFGLVFIVRWVVNRMWWAKPTLRRLDRAGEKAKRGKIEIRGTKNSVDREKSSGKTFSKKARIFRRIRASAIGAITETAENAPIKVLEKSPDPRKRRENEPFRVEAKPKRPRPATFRETPFSTKTIPWPP
jgi:hypothetical protein